MEHLQLHIRSLSQKTQQWHHYFSSYTTILKGFLPLTIKHFIMEALVEKIITGKWKSFKIFKRLGHILLHSERQFQEFDFIHDRMLIIKLQERNRTEVLAKTDQWNISFQKQKHFLTVLVPKMIFEIITINHTVLVLLDMASGEKIFFAREQHWPEYLKANHSFVI